MPTTMRMPKRCARRVAASLSSAAAPGRRLLLHLEERVAAMGNHTVRLDTNSVLQEAIALYASSGYREIGRYNDNPYARHWFEKTLG